MFFVPKIPAYYYVEKELEKHKVIMSNESVIDNWFSLELEDTNVTFDSIKSAEVEKVNIKLFVLYNTVKIENIQLSPPIIMTLEQSLEFIDDDELVEVTPQSIRVRKRHLTENERKRASRLPKDNKD